MQLKLVENKYMNNIPKIIHYCWFGRNPLPELAIKCIESWKKFLPDYEIREWNEDNFDINQSYYTKEAYNKKKYAFVSDYVRLKVIYEYGGIYFDTDVEVIKDFSSIFTNKDDNSNTLGHLGFERENIVATGLGFSASRHDSVVLEMLKEYNDSHFLIDGKCDTTPCTIRNTNALIRLGLQPNNKLQIIGSIIVYPTEYFCPIEYDTGKITITKNTYSIHHFGYSWADEYSIFVMKIKQKVFNLIKNKKTAEIIFFVVNKFLLVFKKLIKR